MNDCRRDRLLEAISALRSRYPAWRFGQLVANVTDWADQNIWDIEDEELLAAAEGHLQRVAQKQDQEIKVVHEAR